MLKARAVALAPADRPQLFPVVDTVLGPNASTLPEGAVDPTVLTAAIETLALLGVNTVQALSFGDQTASQQAVLAGWGITRYRYAIFRPSSLFSWDANSETATVAAWAADLANQMTSYMAVPLSGVILYHLDDEPGWYYPETINDLLAQSSGVTAFRTYLQALGFVASDVGQAAWEDVFPLLASAAVDLPTRRCYFHTIRFITISYAQQQAANTAALRAAVNADLMTAVNYNNGPRFYIPSPGVSLNNNPDSSADSAWGAPDWTEYGRLLTGGAHWTEDWQYNVFSENWSFRADLLRSAAQIQGATFGGYVVGNRLDIGTAFGGRYKALTLVGKGAKVLEWYTFGPEERFAGNSYSYLEQAYGQIADANRLIAHAEDLLWPGQPLAPKIAILIPYSSQLWDIRPPEQLAYQVIQMQRDLIEILELQPALTQEQYPIDYLGEFDVAERLNDYQVLYVTGFNVAAAAQAAIATWIAAGGVAFFGPGSAESDEYNTPVTTLNAVKGVTTQRLAREYADENFSTVHTPVETLAVTVAGQALASPGTDTLYAQQERLAVTTATVLAQFTDDNSPAIVAQATGSGWAITSGVFLIHNYGNGFAQDPNGLTYNWNARLRGMLTFPARIAGIVPPVSCDTALVEPARLDSAAGIAITLLNWNDAPLTSLTVTVRECPTISRAVLAESQQAVAFTQVGSTVTVTLALATVDVLKLYV